MSLTFKHILTTTGIKSLRNCPKVLFERFADKEKAPDVNLGRLYVFISSMVIKISSLATRPTE